MSTPRPPTEMSGSDDLVARACRHPSLAMLLAMSFQAFHDVHYRAVHRERYFLRPFQKFAYEGFVSPDAAVLFLMRDRSMSAALGHVGGRLRPSSDAPYSWDDDDGPRSRSFADANDYFRRTCRLDDRDAFHVVNLGEDLLAAAGATVDSVTHRAVLDVLERQGVGVRTQVVASCYLCDAPLDGLTVELSENDRHLLLNGKPLNHGGRTNPQRIGPKSEMGRLVLQLVSATERSGATVRKGARARAVVSRVRTAFRNHPSGVRMEGEDALYLTRRVRIGPRLRDWLKRRGRRP